MHLYNNFKHLEECQHVEGLGISSRKLIPKQLEATEAEGVTCSLSKTFHGPE